MTIHFKYSSDNGQRMDNPDNEAFAVEDDFVAEYSYRLGLRQQAIIALNDSIHVQELPKLEFFVDPLSVAVQSE